MRTSNEVAIRALVDNWSPELETDEIPVEEAAGRVLAEDMYAIYNQPVVRASGMDGVAVKSERFKDGIPDTSDWKLGTDYVRADTGDDFDDAFDAVIQIEFVKILENGGLQINDDVEVRPGSHVNPSGNNIKKGTKVAAKGRKLRAQDQAAIVLGGYGKVKVYRKPVVAFIPTGSELVPPGSELKRGQNFDSNSVMVKTLLGEIGFDVRLHPIVKDDPDMIKQATEEMFPEADILILNAGTSKGGEDYCVQYLEKNGKMLFHGVAAVPGRPMSITILKGKPVVNMSGPSVAAMYGCNWLFRQIHARLTGEIFIEELYQTEVTLTGDFGMPPVLSAYSSFDITVAEDGRLLAEPVATRGPGARGMSAGLMADAHYASHIGEQPHKAGEKIKVYIER